MAFPKYMEQVAHSNITMNIGLTEVKVSKSDSTIRITHAGNIGNSIKDDEKNVVPRIFVHA